MKKHILAALAAGFLFSVAGGVAKAQNDNGSAVDASDYILLDNVIVTNSGAPCLSKGTAADCMDAAVAPDPATATPVLETWINGDHGSHNILIITVSADVGLFTANLNAIDYHNFQAVLDAAHIHMVVKVDGHDAIPGSIILDSMVHFDVNAGTPTFLNLDLTGELGARSFTFFYVVPNDANIWSGHKVEVDAWPTVDVDVFSAHGFLVSDVLAILGKRTLVVQKSYISWAHSH